jgi:hypothetical protein
MRPPLSPVAKNSPVWSNSTAEMMSAVWLIKWVYKIFVVPAAVSLKTHGLYLPVLKFMADNITQ